MFMPKKDVRTVIFSRGLPVIKRDDSQDSYVLTVGDVCSSSLNGLSFFITILFSISDHLKEVEVA
jgi:hypothetical protein